MSYCLDAIGGAIQMIVELVHTVEETYLGLPNKGVADFGGVAHRFAILGLCSFDWTQPDWFFESKLPDHDLYELVPLADPSKPKIVRHGCFSQSKSPDAPSKLEQSSWDAVEWKPLINPAIKILRD